MKNALIIFFFTLIVTLFYNKVGQLVPQKELHPPKTFELGADMSTEEMVGVGAKIVEQKCMSCHAVQPRFPKLDGVGAVSGSRIEGYSDVDYLAETLYEPDAFIVPPFSKGMTPANKPPLNLSDKEILSVIAYLQSLGGSPSVTMATELKYQSEEGSAPAAASATSATDGADPTAEMNGEELSTHYGCAACHSLTTADRLVGPGLGDIGKRMSKAELYEAIMEPDATMADGGEMPYPPGMMGANLDGGGFYKKVSSAQLKMMVDYLSSLKGE